MCGRYTLTDSGGELLRHFQLDSLPEAYTPRYNIAPTQPVLAIIADRGERRAGFLRWGLIPSWADDPRIGHRMINARAETVAERPSFRTALRRRRCLIPADGFYEWHQRGERKQPVRFVAAGGGLFAFAGLWETWRRKPGAPPEDGGHRSAAGAGPPEEELIHSCTMITTEANDFVRPIHHRMPVLLSPEDYDLWLDRNVRDPEAVLPLLKSPPEDALQMYDVSVYVNSPRNESPTCIAPLFES